MTFEEEVTQRLDNIERAVVIIVKPPRPWVPINEAMYLLCLENDCKASEYKHDRALLNEWMNKGFLKFKKITAKRIDFHYETILIFLEDGAYEAYALKKKKKIA